MTQNCAPMRKLPMTLVAPHVPAPCEEAFGGGCRAGLGCLIARSSRHRCQEPAEQFWGAGGTRRVGFVLLCFALLSFAVAPVRRAPLRKPL